ncbi:hypothetical protein J2T57_000215 [Natronocella acetinitrilica]|uniref:Uncharacterized protein n=1 Tax=Natronocella acetinitrilica TaxID=414046 RepID=A0AAE3G298_9GAMM|nr:hypothetical protein [Natronocella acetinitrilica]MCP1673123.1 hypothetical protein [Natronocella acetinitrilica]
MRAIIDADGREWSVTLGRESYGMQVLLFVAAGAGVRKALLASDTRIDAQAELDQLTDAGLRERLAASVPWEDSLMG